eukprot:m.45686 g.45686  ORF g.45686 m.45686 type:complete len:724 (-) comp12195_c0_seq1:373-2544(-)
MEHTDLSSPSPPELEEQEQVDTMSAISEPRTPPNITVSIVDDPSFFEWNDSVMQTPPRSANRRPIQLLVSPSRPRPIFCDDDTDVDERDERAGYLDVHSDQQDDEDSDHAKKSARMLSLPRATLNVATTPARQGGRARTPTQRVLQDAMPLPHLPTSGFGPELLQLEDELTRADQPESPLTFCELRSHIQLRNQPATPRSLLHKAQRGTFQRHNSVVRASDIEDQNSNSANVNPFTPKAKAKRDHEDSQRQSRRTKKKTFNVVARYRKEFVELGIIGRGDFGTVYKCRHKLDGMLYAIKKSTKRIAGLAEEDRLLREVYAHAVLQAQPYIVRYYSAWEEDDKMLIQNEYCDGGTLAGLFQKHVEANQHFRESTLLRILKHVALGAQALHQQNLAHMDIKPANIFIKNEFSVAVRPSAGTKQASYPETPQDVSSCNSSRTTDTTFSGGRDTSLCDSSFEEERSRLQQTMLTDTDTDLDDDEVTGVDAEDKSRVDYPTRLPKALFGNQIRSRATLPFVSPASSCNTDSSGDVFLSDGEDEDAELLEDLLHAGDEEDMPYGAGVKRNIVFKLGDLGLVTERGNRNADEGDSRYLAREVLQNRYMDLAKADIFSIGCTLYELASLTSLAPNGPAWHKLRDSPTRLPMYSDSFNDLLLAMLAENPRDRPSADKLLAHELLNDKEDSTSTQLQQALDRVRQLEKELAKKQRQLAQHGKIAVRRKQSCLF